MNPGESETQRGNAPTLRQAILRGFSLRCAMCGEGKLFRGMFRMHPHCSHCGFVFERAPGYFLGSTYINYGLTAGTTTVSYVFFHFGLGFRNSQVLPCLLVFCGIFPLVFFRYARSLWLSLDCCMDQVGASEVPRDRTSVGILTQETRNGTETGD